MSLVAPHTLPEQQYQMEIYREHLTGSTGGSHSKSQVSILLMVLSFCIHKGHQQLCLALTQHLHQTHTPITKGTPRALAHHPSHQENPFPFPAQESLSAGTASCTGQTESGGFRPQNRLFKLPSPPSSFQLEVQTLLLEGLMYCWEDVYLSSWEGPDFSFEEDTGQCVWKNPVDNGSPRRYENSTFERAIHYVFFKDPGRGGGRKAASKARSSWDRGRPLAPAYQLPKTHIQLESHKSCSKDHP